jgi:large subunit ribosomal protein L29
MRADELRDMTNVELGQKLKEFKEELFNLRFQHATAQLDNPMRIKEVKRDIARVKTIIRERELGIKRA